jgi:branched-chain amino acid transport system ATP-binding protein
VSGVTDTSVQGETAEAASPYMLELENITGGYGDTTVLRNVSLSVPEGSVVALLGPNGAGKTTTLRIASGLLSPSQGRVLLNGRDVTKLRPHQRSRLGLCTIPEGRGIFPSLNVRDNLIMHMSKQTQGAVIDQAVDAFPVLGRRMRQIAGTLSGGEQQMLAVVRAYVANPSIVLVDEASLGLAPLVVDSIFGFLKRIANEGVALLMVEQYISRAIGLSSTVYFLSSGEIIHSGPSSEITEERAFELYSERTTGQSA